VSVHNNRTDAEFNSTPITDVFKHILPQGRGSVYVSVRDLPDILTSLVLAKKYFGISVMLFEDESSLYKLCDL
jgi:hypothetical protein